MDNKHVFLKNNRTLNDSFKRTRGRGPQTEIEEEIEEKENTIKLYQIEKLNRSYSVFQSTRQQRYSNRTIEFPAYIDLIQIQFFPFFSEDLKKKFFLRYGLLPISYKDYNKTVIFEVREQTLFEEFKNDLEQIINSEEDVLYSGRPYNLLANIYDFSFFDKRIQTDESENIILSCIQSSNTEIDRIQKNALKQLLINNEIQFSLNETEDLFYLPQVENNIKSSIGENFDIVQAITSSRQLTVRPGKFGSLRTDYGFTVDVIDDLPIVGIIDSGINEIPPFRGLVSSNPINITGHIDQDLVGHGTLVAGLTIFGSELPSSVKDSYRAKCRVLAIKAIHHGNDGIDFPLLLESIEKANSEQGVRIFNMSLAFHPKKYNESFSDFAYELDTLAHKLDILIFISVGNFDSVSLRDLLGDDEHPDHAYPDFYYKPESNSIVHSCENTNISTPSESLNNISIGALAGNVEEGDNSDITPINYYPAYYTRKFHLDYDERINSTKLGQYQKNKNLNKPDFVFDGGDLFSENSGIEVLATEGNYYLRTCGTSLSTPLITSLAAEILTNYPSLRTQSVKALLMNSASYFKSSQLPAYNGKNLLLKKLVGHGVPQKAIALNSDSNSITFVIEDEIKSSEIVSIPIFLPQYLQEIQNKLIFDISLAYSFIPERGNHLNYLPLQMAFNLFKNISISDIANNKASETVAKKGFSWSEDHFGKENRLYSNTQKKQYRLQPDDIINLNGEIAIAVRCLSKNNISDTLKQHLELNYHKYSIVIKITEELKNDSENRLYDEMIAINTIEIISDADLDADLEN